MRVIERDIASALIFSKEGKLLQLKNIEPLHGAYGECWVIPGGGVEDGETSEEAMVREVMEEIGLDVSSSIKELVWTGDGQSPVTLKKTGEQVIIKMHFNNYRVQINQPADEVLLILGDEHKEYAWFETSELKNLNLSKPSVDCLNQLGYL